MRISERGSAVAEFVFLVLPLVGLAGSTLGVTWYSFARAQLVQITSEAAMQLAEADSNEDEVRSVVADKLSSRMATHDFSFAAQTKGGLATVSIEIPKWELLNPFSMVFPELSVVSHAPLEI